MHKVPDCGTSEYIRVIEHGTRSSGTKINLCNTYIHRCEHNNANMLSIGQRQVSLELVKKMIQEWISADFEAGRHVARIQMLS